VEGPRVHAEGLQPPPGLALGGDVGVGQRHLGERRLGPPAVGGQLVDGVADLLEVRLEGVAEVAQLLPRDGGALVARTVNRCPSNGPGTAGPGRRTGVLQTPDAPGRRQRLQGRPVGVGAGTPQHGRKVVEHLGQRLRLGVQLGQPLQGGGVAGRVNRRISMRNSTRGSARGGGR
jgi:hypothetical protein